MGEDSDSTILAYHKRRGDALSLVSMAVTEPMLGSSLVTTEKLNVVRYGHDGGLAEG